GLWWQEALDYTFERAGVPATVTTLLLLIGYPVLLLASVSTVFYFGLLTTLAAVAALYADMTPRTLLNFFADLRGMPPSQFDARFESIVHICTLGSVLGKPIGKLSKGFRQRVGMAQSLLHDPDVLILDEPTAGLDPNQIREVRKMIRELGQSKTILLSTHILQEVEAMCNRVVFINEGRLVFDGTPTQLSEQQTNLDERFHQLTTTS
ncbi:MAG: ATP-binding cassette domain-containing protein, partial [Pirellulales bacterium]|nr:ATP-binding cassette domain-containing protein [Pirellulales bacterium]